MLADFKNDTPNYLHVNLLFYSRYGRHIRINRGVFNNSSAMFTDLGGITLEEDVLIAPRMSVLTVGHPENPAQQRGLTFIIKKNTWIDAGVIILPNATVGENAIVAAGAVVNKDVPANTLVSSVPARMLKTIDGV